MKKIVLLSVILAFYTGFGQSPSLPHPEPYFAAILVNDLDTSISWYAAVFGFETLNRTELTERGIKQTNLKCGNILLELIELESSVSQQELLKERPVKTKIDGFFKSGFLVPEFEKWVAHLRQSEVPFHGDIVTDNLSGKKMVIVTDPDGNRIQLFEK